jgi:FKBP-type peptidyl-prolyl cis-trans isomerase 2
MATTGPSRILVVVLIAVIIAVAGVGIWVLHGRLVPSPTTPPLTTAVGQNVTVNYIGEFGSGPQFGKVFDTSIYSVYLDNATYPKSLLFPYSHPGSASSYVPLGVHLGPGNPDYTVGNVTFRGVVPGFWQGMLNMQVNQTRWVTMPVNLAYGPLNPACEATVPLNFTTPVLTTVTAANFSSHYPGVSASAGTTFADPTYGWTDLVFTVNTTFVTVESLPTVGFVAHLSGWNATVTAVNATAVSLVNDITPQNYQRLVGTFPAQRTCEGAPASHYLIAGVDLVHGTFTQNWNTEVSGQSLTFRITVVAIFTG